MTAPRYTVIVSSVTVLPGPVSFTSEASFGWLPFWLRVLSNLNGTDPNFTYQYQLRTLHSCCVSLSYLDSSLFQPGTFPQLPQISPLQENKEK